MPAWPPGRAGRPPSPPSIFQLNNHEQSDQDDGDDGDNVHVVGFHACYRSPERPAAGWCVELHTAGLTQLFGGSQAVRIVRNVRGERYQGNPPVRRPVSGAEPSSASCQFGGIVRRWERHLMMMMPKKSPARRCGARRHLCPPRGPARSRDNPVRFQLILSESPATGISGCGVGVWGRPPHSLAAGTRSSSRNGPRVRYPRWISSTEFRSASDHN